MDFIIMTDSSANLPGEYVTQHNIPVVPFSYFIDGQEVPCPTPDQFDGKTFYDRLRRRDPVTTSQINVARYTNAMEPLLKDGKDILFVGMSSGISGAFHSAELAAEDLRAAYPHRRIRLVDTLAASMGEGLIVMKAVDMRAAGLSVDAAAAQLNALRMRLCQVFTVDDLEFLRRGGRLSGTAAMVGTLLQIKPILKGNEAGQIVKSATARGRRRSIETLAERYDALAVSPETETVAIAHADCAEDADYLARLLNKNRPPKEIVNVLYEPVTGSHVGPGTIALFFFADEEVRKK